MERSRKEIDYADEDETTDWDNFPDERTESEQLTDLSSAITELVKTKGDAGLSHVRTLVREFSKAYASMDLATMVRYARFGAEGSESVFRLCKGKDFDGPR
jgi:hypothetical protein